MAGKLLKSGIGEIMPACNANIGDPSAAAALAIGKGWRTPVYALLGNI
ncbi:MAG: hypothetical protein Q3970_08920 [Neisseria sp.]|nr:hypothetical protein [Neisseria sp.]